MVVAKRPEDEPSMEYGGQKPISVIKVNDKFILAIYRGRKGPADILIKYRQKLKSGWSRIRTPKHIHWTVDVLIKMSQDKELTQRFLGELLKIWETVKPMSPEERDALDLQELLRYDQETLRRYRELSRYGEYNVKFLLLLARLLMLQEKTNYPEGKMFQGLLGKLREGEDLFGILQKATLGRRG